MRKNLSDNWKSSIIYILIPLILIGGVLFMSGQNKQADMDYSKVVNLFRTNQVSQFEIDLSSGKLNYKLFKEDKKTPLHTYNVPSVTYFIDDISESVNEYNAKNPKNQIVYNYKKGSGGSMFMSLMPTLLLVFIIAGFSFWMIKKMGNTLGSENNRALGFGKIKAKTNHDEDKKTFDDVAGCDEEKDELTELVDFLKQPEQYTQLGARIPKGVLLVGPPGTGKTLLARAVAGEADAPFLSISGSDFVEMYVGVGASRVRDLFEQAKKQAPAIVFIDEIDAVGRHRGTGLGNTNDEREQTLNQLLVEMDGFGTNSGVIVIAATNRPDVLDPALLRPGRFDRQITVNRPDMQGREDILKIHSKKKPLAPDVDLKEVAKNTIGFTGADLENLMNEAAIIAVRNKRKAITAQDIVDAASRVEMGTEKKSHKYTEKAKRLTAYHEAGHAVTSYFIKDYYKVKEISIIPRGLGAGGYTRFTPDEENYESRQDMLNELLSLFGGRVAEALALGDISTGASNDLQRASEICRSMVKKLGMTEALGPVVYDEGNNQIFLGKDYGQVNNYSEDTGARIDKEVERLMREAYEKTEAILKEHYDKLELVAETLFDKEKLSDSEFIALMENGRLDEPEAVPEEAAEAPAEDNAVEDAPITIKAPAVENPDDRQTTPKEDE